MRRRTRTWSMPGVERRPEGFGWFVRLPVQFSTSEELRAAVTGSVYAGDPQLAHQAEIAPVMKHAVQRLYAAGQE